MKTLSIQKMKDIKLNEALVREIQSIIPEVQQASRLINKKQWRKYVVVKDAVDILEVAEAILEMNLNKHKNILKGLKDD